MDHDKIAVRDRPDWLERCSRTGHSQEIDETRLAGGEPDEAQALDDAPQSLPGARARLGLVLTPAPDDERVLAALARIGRALCLEPRPRDVHL